MRCLKTLQTHRELERAQEKVLENIASPERIRVNSRDLKRTQENARQLEQFVKLEMTQASSRTPENARGNTRKREGGSRKHEKT